MRNKEMMVVMNGVNFDRFKMEEVIMNNRFNLEPICKEEIKEFIEALKNMDELPDGVNVKKWVKTYEELLGEVADVIVVGYQLLKSDLDYDMFGELSEEDYKELKEIIEVQKEMIGIIVDYKLNRTIFRNRYDYYRG
jgi:hypothetical protein